MVLMVCFFGILRSQQLDVYRDIARSQQQIMTVYKYLLTEYVHELDVQKLTSKIIKSMLENFDPYTEYYEEKDLEDLAIKTDGEFSGVGLQIYMYEDQLTIRPYYCKLLLYAGVPLLCLLTSQFYWFWVVFRKTSIM